MCKIHIKTRNSKKQCSSRPSNNKKYLLNNIQLLKLHKILRFRTVTLPKIQIILIIKGIQNRFSIFRHLNKNKLKITIPLIIFHNCLKCSYQIIL